MNVELALFLAVLLLPDLSLAFSKKDFRFRSKQEKDEVVGLEAPQRQIFDFLALEPQNYSPSRSSTKRTRLVTFHLPNANYPTQLPKLLGKRKSTTYARPTASYSYYRRGHHLRSNASTGQLENNFTKLSPIIVVNRSNKVNDSRVLKKSIVQHQYIDFVTTSLPTAETYVNDNTHLESNQHVDITEEKSNSTLPSLREYYMTFTSERNIAASDGSLKTDLDTFKPSDLKESQLSYFLTSATTPTSVFLNVTLPKNLVKNSTFNSAYTYISYFPNFNNSTYTTSSEYQINFLLNNDTTVPPFLNFTSNNSGTLSPFVESITFTTPAPLSDSTSSAFVTNEQKSLRLGKQNILEEIPSHFRTAPISPARVAALLGYQAGSQGSISNWRGQPGGFLSFGDYGKYGGLNGQDESISDLNLGYTNFGLNFDLLDSPHILQLGSQRTSANQENPLFGGLSLDYLTQLANPKASDSSQLDLAQTLSSMEALKSPAAADDLSAIGSHAANTGSPSFPSSVNFNDFLGLGSLSFLQGQQAPLNHLNSDSLLSSLSFSPQFLSRNPSDVLPAPKSDSSLSAADLNFRKVSPRKQI